MQRLHSATLQQKIILGLFTGHYGYIRVSVLLPLDTRLWVLMVLAHSGTLLPSAEKPLDFVRLFPAFPSAVRQGNVLCPRSQPGLNQAFTAEEILGLFRVH